MMRSAKNLVRKAIVDLARRPDSRYLPPHAIRRFWIESVLDLVSPHSIRHDGDYTSIKLDTRKTGLDAAREVYLLSRMPDEKIISLFWSLAAEV